MANDTYRGGIRVVAKPGTGRPTDDQREAARILLGLPRRPSK